MSEWTSLSCKSDTKSRINELKEDGETQDDVLNRALDALQSQNGEGHMKVSLPEGHDGPTPEEIKDVRERIQDMQERMKDMDVVSNNQRVLTRIDDLETELKTHFERELRK